MPVSIKGTGGGGVTLDAGAAASTTTLTLPNVNGTVALTASPTFSGTVTATTITSPAATALTIQSAASTAMTIDTSQNVGIGTASPTRRLDVSAPSCSAALTSTTGTNAVNFNFNNTGGLFSVGIDNSTGSGFGAGAYGRVLYSDGAYPLVVYTNGTERMRINSSGNVGIGTASPSADTTYKWLNIVGPTTSGGGIVQLNNSDSSVGINMFCNNLAGYVGTSTSHPLLFRINSSEAARIDTSGNLLVGTTSQGGSYNGRFVSATGSGLNAWLAKDTQNNGAIASFVNNSNGLAGTITISGTTTTYGTSSDYRLKHDVQPLSFGLSTVSALKPVTYKWQDNSYGEGFIAHELQEVIPLAVTGEKDAVNEDDSIKPQGVDYSKIVVHLVAAIQELKADLDAAKAEIATLKGAA
jgi:hypothetical protein